MQPDGPKEQPLVAPGHCLLPKTNRISIIDGMTSRGDEHTFWHSNQGEVTPLPV